MSPTGPFCSCSKYIRKKDSTHVDRSSSQIECCDVDADDPDSSEEPPVRSRHRLMMEVERLRSFNELRNDDDVTY